ncbi:MAG: hypothetical protein MMC33_002337 [Icmadophila ericetorum]|nr:hypothetical protein [Icmadophila ericetorum]
MRSFRTFQRTFQFNKHSFGAAQQPRYGYTIQRGLNRQASPFSLPTRLQPIRSSRPTNLLTRNRRYNSTNSTNPPSSSPNPTPNLGSPEPSLTLSQRLRKLSREYGWSALGVYLLFSALDFPFCFLAVRWLGTERIGRWEHTIVEWVKRASPIQIPLGWRKKQEVGQGAGDGQLVLEAGLGELVVPYDHGVQEAERMNRSEKASIWTQLALAYAIHKSFIFLRVPLTAAVTPKVVKVLRGWGWDIGKRTSTAARTAKRAANEAAKKS